MPAVSDQIAARSRKNESEILRAIRRVTQARVADLLGVAASTVSRMCEPGTKGGAEAPSFVLEVARFLAAAGLKAVPEDAEVFELKRIEALRELAKIGIEHAGRPSGFGDIEERA